MIAVAAFCILVFISSLWSEFDNPRWRVLRGNLFLALGLSTIVPFVHMFVFM